MSVPDDPTEITLTGRLQVPAGQRALAVTVADVGGASVQGPARTRNEDAWAHELGRSFVVVDGMGGRAHGDLAAQLVVDGLLGALRQPAPAWRDAVVMANRHLLDQQERRGLDHCGAVAVALRVDSASVTVLHIGDARAYRLRGGLAQQLTRDHSVGRSYADHGVGRVEAGVPDAHLRALTGYLGDPDSALEHAQHDLHTIDGDRIVLCSDGVHAVVTPSDWRRTSTIRSAGDAAAHLVERALSSGGTDDATALVIDLATSADTGEVAP